MKQSLISSLEDRERRERSINIAVGFALGGGSAAMHGSSVYVVAKRIEEFIKTGKVPGVKKITKKKTK